MLFAHVRAEASPEHEGDQLRVIKNGPMKKPQVHTGKAQKEKNNFSQILLKGFLMSNRHCVFYFSLIMTSF